MSESDLREMCGLERPSAQARWLKSYGIAFVVRADGKLSVMRDTVVKAMGDHRRQSRVASTAPDLAAIRGKA